MSRYLAVALSTVSMVLISLFAYSMTVGPNDIKNNAVRTKHIKKNNVTSSDIKNNNVKGKDIRDGTIEAADLADGAVETAKIENQAITNTKISPQAVSTPEIADGSVTEDKLSSALRATIDSRPKVAFQLKQIYTGNLVDAAMSCCGYAGDDGLEAADAICNFYADGVDLAGTYAAWLSTSSVDAKDRVLDRMYLTTDGRIIETSISGLTDGSLFARIDRDQLGDVSEHIVWTGTASDGTGTISNCSDWTDDTVAFGLIGQGASSSASWTAGGSPIPCSLERSLYCFEVSM